MSIDWESMKHGVVGSAREQWPSEVRDLTPWVLEKFDDLGQELGLQLKPIGREVAAGTFRVDIAARDSSGRLVIIENQHGPSDHGHFGQIVLYALESRADVIVWLVTSDVHWRVSGGIRPEHRRALGRLNEVFAGKIEFYGVEVELASELVPLDEPHGPILPRIEVPVRPGS